MIRSLTSLRFLFAIMIFMHHYKVNDSSLFPEGYLGVTFFFILSGFVLSLNACRYNLQAERKEFILKRLSKLYPLHLLCLCIALFSGSVFICKQIILNVLLLQSWTPRACFSYNAVSWCLSDQIFFYICFPFLVYVLQKLTLRMQFCYVLIQIVLILIASLIVPPKYNHFIFYICPLVRLSDFILGIILCNIYRYVVDRQLIARTRFKANTCETISILILFLFIFISGYVPQFYRYGLFYWIPMSLLIMTFAYFDKCGGWFSSLLSHHILVKLGSASFCFYMLHLLCFRLRSIVTISEIWQIECFVLFVFVSILSLLCHKYFERPIDKYLRRKINNNDSL